MFWKCKYLDWKPDVAIKSKVVMNCGKTGEKKLNT